jgi:hypothetical protein
VEELLFPHRIGIPLSSMAIPLIYDSYFKEKFSIPDIIACDGTRTSKKWTINESYTSHISRRGREVLKVEDARHFRGVPRETEHNSVQFRTGTVSGGELMDLKEGKKDHALEEMTGQPVLR